MNVSMALKTLEHTILEMKDQDLQSRLNSLCIISLIVNKLEEYAKERPNICSLFREYKLKLMWSCEVLCCLDEGNGHDDSMHITWALGAIDNIKSALCLGNK